MTGRHSGLRLSIAGFAARAGVTRGTFGGYLSRSRRDPNFFASNKIPEPCWPDDSLTRDSWCAKHADAWINNRPRKHPKEST